MSDKQCSICQEIKPVTEFYKHYNKKPGWTLAHCKTCNYEKYQRPAALKRLERQGKKPKVQLSSGERKARQAESQRVYRATEKGREARYRYAEKLRKNKPVTVKSPKPEKIKTHEQIELEKQKKREWRRSYYLKTRIIKEKPVIDLITKKLKKSLRRCFKKALDSNKTGGKAVAYLGCTIPQFKEYLATLFTDEMSWDNYGLWHIDHIKPLCSFDLRDEDEIKKAKQDIKLKFMTVELKTSL